MLSVNQFYYLEMITFLHMYTANIELANQVEEHCADISTGDDTDVIIHNVSDSQRKTKRICKKKKFFDDTSFDKDDSLSNDTAEENEGIKFNI